VAALIARRLASGIPILLGVSLLIFVLIALVPGDPAAILAGDNATPQQIAQIRAGLGLDEPLPVRYLEWLGGALQGDLGESFINGEPVLGVILSRVAVTASLVGFTVLLTLLIGPPAGLAAARRPGGVVDRVVTALAAMAIAVPPFWFGLILVLVLAVQLGWFPALGYSPLGDGLEAWVSHLFLPALTLALLPAAEVAMQLRASLADVLTRDYVITAEAKGLSARSVLLKHALKNAAMPVVTVFGYRFAQVLGGTVTIETVFALPGLGTVAVASVLTRDVPVLLGLIVFTTLVVIVVNLLVDISYGYLNPKVRT